MPVNNLNFVLWIYLLSLMCAVQGVDTEPNKHKDKYFLHKRCETALHKQINEEKRASLLYTTMAAHFKQNSIARHGFSKLFLENAKEKEEHAQKFIDFLNVRGSKFMGFDVKMPSKDAWNNGLEALRDAVDLEKHINVKLNGVHDIAAMQCTDQHLMDFLENEFLDEQVEAIDKLKRHISVLKEMNSGTGEYLFDRQLLGEKEL